MAIPLGEFAIIELSPQEFEELCCMGGVVGEALSDLYSCGSSSSAISCGFQYESAV